ncbi:MAG: A/G-specific adenine glycosylase [Chitinophagaceae bacterium]|nr:MAG: A/G-specific adenine glycosylase [Chitinophagaceae bacterium]
MWWNQNMNDRLMPWKGEKDPYKIWLSEIILQQTRVEQGWEYYLRFVKKYPVINKLAAANDDEVFKLWEGLGYYSRCRNLLATARFISHELKGKFPSQYNDIVQLKGVGPYTASAIASFAFNLPNAVVDGNVNRVLARYFGIQTAIDSTEGKKHFAALAQELLPLKEPGLYNQAIMDFGATICKPQLPLCVQCVLSKHCAAYNTGRVNELPVKEKKIIKKNRWFYYIVLEKEGRYFVRKRGGKDIWQNLHEFILIEWPASINAEELVTTDEFKSMVPGRVDLLNISKEYRQQLTHQTIHAVFIEAGLLGSKLPKGFEVVDIKTMKQKAFPRMLNHFIEHKGWK